MGTEKQLTKGPGGRILTNTGVWSPDSRWIVFDTRSDASGEQFDGDRIQMVNAETGEVRTLFQSRNGAHCGVASFHPTQQKVAFILGPEHPTSDWQYGPSHRQGVILDTSVPEGVIPLDACDLTPPFTAGALRGGSHVHVWAPAGDWVSFTYEDALLTRFAEPGPDHDTNMRNVGVSVPVRVVVVPKSHPRNHDGAFFSVLVTRTTALPQPGSDQIERAYEEGWVGTNGYVRTDGTRQRRALAFQGLVRSKEGERIPEVFIVDLPDDVTVMGEGPLAGTELRLPKPPKGTVQRRLTFTTQRKYPGIAGPRHWLRSSPDGGRIAFLMKDDAGIVQLWTVSPTGGEPVQLTRNTQPIASSFSWSADGRYIAHAMDGSICVTLVDTGETLRLTDPVHGGTSPRPEACVISPDSTRIAYVRRVGEGALPSNQIFTVTLPDWLNSPPKK